jgi:hypothetical protein
MTKRFFPENRDKLTKDEQMFLNSWTDNKYFLIQSVIAKKFRNLSQDEKEYVQKAKTLLNMFIKYKSKYPKDRIVFRGLKFDKRKREEVEKFKKVSRHIQELYRTKSLYEHSIVPFSTSKQLDVAMDFANAKLSNFYSIVLFLQNRISDELDISNLSSANESEILVQGGLKYRVVKFAYIKNILYSTLEEVI